MRRYWRLLPVAVLLGAVACESGRHSPSGFRLPADGDVERGKTAFVALECHHCHEVSGVELPKPAVQPAQVVLGGPVVKERTDGSLVTSIINPNYKRAGHRKDLITIGGRPRMPEYADRITVRQLTDLVAFLQSRYTVRRDIPKYPYY
jgi:sulfur-oxidizing protein SoxX